MNIYIPIEIKARELEGRGLLAIAAAERGHTVLLGGKGDTRLLPATGVLPPGIFHTKSLTPSESKVKILTKLKNHGHFVTAQDEESGLVDESYDKFAKIRYSDESVSLASAIFAWGEHDAASIRKNYSEFADRVVVTGSPRVDFWRVDFAGYYSEKKHSKRPYILIASNFGTLMDENRMWNVVARMRSAGYFSRDPAFEEHVYKNAAYQTRLVYEFVVMIRKLSETYPDVDILVRPHPVESIDAWKKIIGDFPNIIVKREGSISSWIRNSTMLIHNGCTSALEAAAGKIPRIAYRPIPSEIEREIPNRMSHQVFSLDDLLNTVDVTLSRGNEAEEPSVQVETDKLLSKRLLALDGKLAADRMVDQWERIAKEENLGQSAPEELLRLRPKNSVPLSKRLKRGLVKVRNSIITPKGEVSEDKKLLVSHHKFPDLKESEMENLLEKLQKSQNRFHDVQFTRFGKRSFILYSSRQNG